MRLCDSSLIDGKLRKVFGKIPRGLPVMLMSTDETVLTICLPNWNGWKLFPEDAVGTMIMILVLLIK